MKTRHRLVTFIVMVTLLYQDILLAQGCLSPRRGLEDLEGLSQFGAQVYLGFRQVAERGLDKLDHEYEKYIRFNKDSIVKLSEDGNPFFTIDVELIQTNILLTVVFFDSSRPPRRYLEKMCKTWAEEDGFWIISKKEGGLTESVRVSKRFGYMRYHIRRIVHIIWEKYLKEYTTRDLRYYLLVLPNIAIVLIRDFGIFLKMVFLKRYRNEYINKIIRNILVKNLDDLSISVEEIEDIREDKSNRAVTSFAFIITWIIMNELLPAPLAGAFVLALPIPWLLKIPMVLISGGIIRAIGIIIAKYLIYPDLKISKAIPVALPKWIGIPWSLSKIMDSYSYNFSRLIEGNRIQRFRRLVEGLIVWHPESKELEDPDIKNSVIRKLLRYGSSAKCTRLLKEMIDKPEGYPERVPMYEKFIELIEQNTVTLAIDFGAEKISAALINNDYEVQGEIVKHKVKEGYKMDDVEEGRAFIIEQLRNVITDAVQLAEDKGLILDIAIVTMEGLSSYKRGTIDYSSRFRIVEGVRFREIIEDIMEKSGIKGVRLYIIDEGYAAVFGEKNFGPHEDKSLFYLGLNTTLRAARIGRNGNFISQTEFGYLYKAEINNERIELNKIAGRRRLADLAERLAKLPENKEIYDDFKGEYRVQGKLGLFIMKKALRDGNPFAVKVYETAARFVGAAILTALRDETIKSYDKIVIGGDLDRYGLVNDDLKEMFLNNVRAVVQQGYRERTHAIVMSGLDNTRELKGAKYYVLNMIEGRSPEKPGGAMKDIGPPIEIKTLEKTVRSSNTMNVEVSRLSGLTQRIKGVSILQFAIPISVLKSAGDFVLVLKKMGMLRNTIFELILYDLDSELDGDKFIKMLDLPKNVRVYGITKAQAGDVRSLKDFIKDRYPLKVGGYLMIATDFVNSEAAEAEAASLQANLEENVSLRVVVRPDETSVISLSNILSSWLKDLGSSIKIILPLPISPQELKRRLEEEMQYLWEFLVST